VVFGCITQWCDGLGAAPLDLGFLQPAAIVHKHRLEFGELVNGRGARLPAAVTGLFDSAKGKMDFGPDGGSVDISDPSF